MRIELGICTLIQDNARGPSSWATRWRLLNNWLSSVAGLAPALTQSWMASRFPSLLANRRGVIPEIIRISRKYEPVLSFWWRSLGSEEINKSKCVLNWVLLVDSMIRCKGVRPLLSHCWQHCFRVSSSHPGILNNYYWSHTTEEKVCKLNILVKWGN